MHQGVKRAKHYDTIKLESRFTLLKYPTLRISFSVTLKGIYVKCCLLFTTSVSSGDDLKKRKSELLLYSLAKYVKNKNFSGLQKQSCKKKNYASNATKKS